MPAHRTARHTPFTVPPAGSAAWLDHRNGTFRRGDVRASDDATYPATDAVRAAITAEPDVNVNTARDIGQGLRNAGGQPYPSWRILDIAEDMGRFHSNRGAVGAAIRPATFNGGLPPGPTPTPPEPIEPIEPSEPPESERPMPEQQAAVKPVKPSTGRAYPTREAVCAGCGVTFTSTRFGSGWTRYHSRECGEAHRQQVRREASPEPAEPEPLDTTHITTTVTERLVPLVSPVATVVWDGASFTQSTSTAQPVNVSLPGYDPRRQLRQSLHLMVDALPEGDTWTRAERSRWLEMIVGLLDFTITAPPTGELEALDWRVG